MSTLYTLKDVAEFCYLNKKRRAFYHHCFNDVAKKVVDFDNRCGLTIVEDFLGICGVCLYQPKYNARIIYVHEIVCVRNGFKTLILKYAQDFPSFRVQGNRLKGFSREPQEITYNKKDLLWVVARQV